MRTYTRSRISLLYICIIILLLGLISVSSFIASMHMQKETEVIVNDSIPIAAAANNLLVDLINQETGIRGYELTGNELYLQPFTTGRVQLLKDLELLRAYQDKYPELRAQLENRAVPIIEELQALYASQIAAVKSGDGQDAGIRVETGKSLMDRYRAVDQEFRVEIQRMTGEAFSRSQKAGQYLETIAVSGIFIALCVAILSGLFFIRAHRAESELRRSEETYRYMAESLETRNEEIIAQQEEQQFTLAKLSSREHELELITTYQEKLTGFVELHGFLKHAVPALLDSLSQDAAIVVLAHRQQPAWSYEVVYSKGYPVDYTAKIETQLFGPAARVIEDGQPLQSIRDLTGKERGLHEAFTSATDQYYPLTDDNQQVIGFLLLTRYHSAGFDEESYRLTQGLIRQFNLAFFAQVMNEDRRKQSIHLEMLNRQLVVEKQHIESQRDLIENILESTHEGMLMCDSLGVILFANQRMNAYFQLDGKVGGSLAEACREIAATAESSSFSSVSVSIQNLLDGNSGQFTQRFSFAAGEQQQHAELYATVVGGDSEQKRYLFVFRDRSEEERIDEMKNEFISIVSHELRTPLSSILGFVEIMLNRELQQEKRRKYMETIYKEALRLSNLINDFLDLQRMETGHQIYHFAPVNLVPTLYEVIEQWQGKMNHQIYVDQPDLELWARADIDRIRQVFHNLISNAVKYSPDADRVDIYLKREHGTISIAIQDYGLGIPDEARESLFSKFFRVDNSDRRQIGGTGLGLAIVKEIMDGHQGAVAFESQMGAGTTFTIQLEEYVLPSIDGNIVIFEDDDNLANLIQIALNKLNLPVVQFRSAEEGVLALRRDTSDAPALFIVDIHLEGCQSGWDFLAELNRHPRLQGTPVIVSTALERPQHYREKEGERYLRKPFTMERLVEVAQHLLETKANNAFVFPLQDKELIASSLEKNGFELLDIRERHDLIEVEIKSPSQE